MNIIVKTVRKWCQHYNSDSYWKMRSYIQDHPAGGVKCLWYAFRIKRMDAFCNASTGIALDGTSAYFESKPQLPHGLYGIIIAQKAHIGKNARIFHQVTIGNDDHDSDNVPTIGDSVTIYPGAKIIGKVYVGDRAIIGANAVVNRDVPADALVVNSQPRILQRKSNNK